MPLGDALDKGVVVGAFKSGLKHIVIDIGNRKLRFNFIYVHGFQLQVDHGTRGILSQGLVHLNGDLGPGDQISLK